jgi:hypothetical protein
MVINWIKNNLLNRSKDVREPFVIKTQDDNTYKANEDVLEGMKFHATLKIFTPLSVLKRHGEFFKGRPSSAPKYGSDRDGIWIYKTKTWSQLGIDLPELSAVDSASDVGPVNPSDYLPFLIELRTIFESNTDDKDKIEKINLLKQKSQKYAHFWSKLEKFYEGFPEILFYKDFTTIPGIGLKMAKKLYGLGFLTLESVLNASKNDLSKVPGLGPSTIGKILNYKAVIKP